MRSRASLAFLTGCLAALAQTAPVQPSSKVKISFPSDSPVTVVSADWGDSRTEARGGAAVVDLHTSLWLKNSSQRRIRGVTLLVLAQEVTPGGKASVAVPSLDIKPGETFPVRIDLRLLRPLFAGSGPLVQVDLDGVLFEDLSFYGPNRLNSQRQMTVWELEARRDRRYFRSVLEARGAQGLQRELLDSMARQDRRPALDVQLSRRGRATAVASSSEVDRQFAFLKFPDAPIEPVRGMARINGAEARSPEFEVVNRSNRSVRYFELGWIIRDREGRQFMAGSIPASESGLKLAPGQKGQVREDAALRFTRRPGEPVYIEGMTGFVSQVEFADGSIWIPGREVLSDRRLSPVLAPSPEEQRLTDMYRKKGLAAVMSELKKF